MAQELLQQWGNQAFTVGQQMAFKWADKKPLMLTVQTVECADLMALSKGLKVSADATMYKRVYPFVRRLISQYIFVWAPREKTSPIGQRCGIHELPHQFSHSFTFMQRIIARESLEIPLMLFSFQ